MLECCNKLILSLLGHILSGRKLASFLCLSLSSLYWLYSRLSPLNGSITLINKIKRFPPTNLTLICPTPSAFDDNAVDAICISASCYHKAWPRLHFQYFTGHYGYVQEFLICDQMSSISNCHIDHYILFTTPDKKNLCYNFEVISFLYLYSIYRIWI